MKKLIACLFVMVAAATVNAAYLNWQVDPEVSGFSYNAARIGYYQTDQLGAGQTLSDLATAGKLNYAGNAYSAPGGVMGAPASLDMSTITSAENYSYFIELVNYNSGTTTHVAFGEDLSYADLVAKNYIDTGMSATEPVTWHGGEYHAVPEPTSALMMVLGLVFLGLKRRKA